MNATPGRWGCEVEFDLEIYQRQFLWWVGSRNGGKINDNRQGICPLIPDYRIPSWLCWGRVEGERGATSLPSPPLLSSPPLTRRCLRNAFLLGPLLAPRV